MKKFGLMMLSLIGLGFIGCESSDNIVWQMGAFSKGDTIIKTYCDLNKQGFAYTMQYMNIGQDGKAVLMDENKVREIFQGLKETRFGNILDKPYKGQIHSVRKDDPSFCASMDMMMSFTGERIIDVEVKRQRAF